MAAATSETPQSVIIYTDGACLGNPGPGGFGVVLLHGGTRVELSGGFRRTTNNRMEIMAAIAGLQHISPLRASVTLYSDSRYLVDSMTKGWAKRWRANGWLRNPKEPAVNPDLWETLLDLCARHDVEFLWVKGHASNRENNRCDALSVQAASAQGLPPDSAYEVAGRASPRRSA